MSKAWMPLYIGDYLRDTMHLTTEEHGAYLLLIFAAWERGNSLREPDLAAIVRLPPKRWAAMRDKLAALFDVADACWTHRRVQRELDAAEGKSRKARESANERWKDKREACDRNANASPEHMPLACSSQSQSEEKETKGVSPPAAAPPETDLYRRGRDLFGPKSGGLIRKLLDAKGGNIALARAALEVASTKADPREYVGGVIRGSPDDDDAVVRPDGRIRM